MKSYYRGAISQHIVRAKKLISRIPHQNLPREFHTLAQTCESELTNVINKFQAILDSLNAYSLENSPEILRRFRREVENLNQIEAYGISALERANISDEFLNKLVDTIRKEIQYPLLPPVVTSLSQQYFQILPRFNLLFVPPSESDFLLHLPDLYHELAHPLCLSQHNPNIEPFQLSLLKSIDAGLVYFDGEITKEGRRRSPEIYNLYLINWRKLWWEWTIEFYCDLFAVYTLGPAFVWSHLHLVMKYGRDVYLVPTFGKMSHPPDNARMQAMLIGLELIGYLDERKKIEKRWGNLLQITESKATPEYNRAFPQQLIRTITENAFDGVKKMGCRIAEFNITDNIHNILNTSWIEFWDNPDSYITWEKKTIEDLKHSL